MRTTVVSAPPDREPRLVTPKRRSTTGVCGRNFDRSPRFQAETSARRDRNSGSTAQTLRRGGRRMSAHAAGMGPRPIGVRLSVCVRVSYPKAAPIGIEIVKRRKHERLQVQT